MANDEAGLFQDGGPRSVRQRVLRRRSSLFQERTPWDGRWRKISQHLLPFAGRFNYSERNRGDRSFNNIIDETATSAHEVLAAGMMSGMTSPARPWFRLATPDPDLMEQDAVKIWLADVSQLMRDIFSRGNTYRALHTIYEELGAFGTTVDILQRDFDNVIWHDPLTIGEFAISTNHKGKVNSMVREFELTVEQIVEMFVLQVDGSMRWDRVSQTVKNMWDTYNYDKGVPVIHLIEPRQLSERDMRYPKFPRNMPYKSVYIEFGQDTDEKVLRESGFKDFPALAARWHTRGGDVYGSSPGMKALGSILQLQQEQMRKSQAIDYMARPPIILPGELKGREVDSLPGGVNYMNISAAGSKAQNLFDVRVDLSHMLEDIKDVRERINKSFYADLFLQLAQLEGVQPRNQFELAQRNEEKLLMLGPVLERLHDELLAPLIDNTFTYMLEGRLLPPLPPELDNVDLKVEFVSTLAQAQRAVGLGALDRLLGTIGNLGTASGDPGVWDKIDKDEAVERYADMLAIDPELIVSDDKVALVRESRNRQAAAAAQMNALPELAKGMKAGAEAGAVAQEAGLSAGTPSGTVNQFTGYAP